MLMRGGNMNKVWIVLATWVWCYAVANGPAWVGPLMAVAQQQQQQQAPLYHYQTVTFTTAGATEDSYKDFIKTLRGLLASGEEPHGIPVTREGSTVPDSEVFVLVKLSNWESDSPITLAINVSNVHVVAYQTGSRSFFLRESSPETDPALSNLFPGSEQHTLPFSGSYGDLERVAGEGRDDIDLGITPLGTAISSLRISNPDQQTPIARSLLVVIQVVADAARFRFIEDRVRQSIATGVVFQPDPAMLSLENNWKALSAGVQQSNQGVFSSPVQLRTTSDITPYVVDSVSNRALAGLALMLFVCRLSDRAPTKNDYFVDHLLIIRPGVDYHVATGVDDTRANTSEPTVRISGRNGLCVDVRDGEYNNGNPIQMWPCKGNSDANQLWTLKKDGTIRSNGRCLATYGFTPGNYIMIYACSTPVTPGTIWQVWDNGTIVNARSGLVLSANSPLSGTTLTLQTNVYASSQAWLASNNTEPVVAAIVGHNDLCMQSEGDAIWVKECASSRIEQKWALYPDGSIRPQKHQERCLTSANNYDPGNVIILSSCTPGTIGQRWVFMNDSTILNLAYESVIAVKGSDSSLNYLVIRPSTGSTNEKWHLTF